MVMLPQQYHNNNFQLVVKMYLYHKVNGRDKRYDISQL